MSVNSISREAIEKILVSLYAAGNRRLASFSYGRPGIPDWAKGLVATVFVHRHEFLQALLFIRQNGAPYLRSISISDLWSMVSNFITGNYWYIVEGNFNLRTDLSFAEQVSDVYKSHLALALANSLLFQTSYELTLYPLIPIKANLRFEGERFFILDARDLSYSHLPDRSLIGDFDASQFPPLVDWKGVRHPTPTWLGVRSPVMGTSRKIAATVLGAVALTALPWLRYQFSGRTMFGGQCTISEKITTSYSERAHTPALMHEVILTQADQLWIQDLESLVEASDDRSRAKCRALEYFYRAWFLSPRERFPALCMSLDSLVQAPGKHTSAAVAFVLDILGTPLDPNRLRLLMRVRGAVIHGAAPDVYESEHYEKYYLEYETDPIIDLELIVAKCLREAIFEGKLAMHSDPNAKLLASLRAQDKAPPSWDDGRIISGHV